MWKTKWHNFFWIRIRLRSVGKGWHLNGNPSLDITVPTVIIGASTIRLYAIGSVLHSKNRDNHENSERHKENVERFLSNQKAEKERKAAHEREVERVLKRAEQVVCLKSSLLVASEDENGRNKGAKAVCQESQLLRLRSSSHSGSIRHNQPISLVLQSAGHVSLLHARICTRRI